MSYRKAREKMIEIKVPEKNETIIELPNGHEATIKQNMVDLAIEAYIMGYEDGVEAYRAMMEIEKEEKDLISRQAVIYYIKPYIQEIITESGVDKNERTNRILRLIINGIETMPTGRGCRHEEDAEDCTSRQEAIRAIQAEYYDHAVGIDIVDIVAHLPSVIPKPEQEPCEDCISRREALSHKHIVYDDDGIGCSVVRVDEIMALPSATPQTKTGKWERYVNDYIKCSKCGALVKSYHSYKYCPKCGCRMVELQESEE